MDAVNLQGVVTPFKGNGRKLGYPTANIKTETDLKDGVYFGLVDLANFVQQPALIFIGTPTTMGDTDRRAEAYLLDIPDKDYYGENLNIDVLKFHRGTITFDNLEELLKAMHQDEKIAREWFKTASSGIARP